MLKKIRHIHFVGIGGIGMCGIAEVLLNLGYTVSGSDLKANEFTEHLKAKGARIDIGHKAENTKGAHVVVFSSAVTPANPELQAAASSRIPVIPRAEMLAELMRLKYGIAVAGTHGKTTTTSMVSLVLTYGGMDPTMVIGGKLRVLGVNAKLGKGEFLVAEADESDGSFLSLVPTIAVVTNVDNDHLDHYGSMAKLKDAFVQFANKVPFYGCAIVCADDPGAAGLRSKATKRVITYGIQEEADIRAEQLEMVDGRFHFTVNAFGKIAGRVQLKVAGRHNVLNALAAVAVGLELDLEFAKIAGALATFTGVTRRLETLGEIGGVQVVDDYAHHPTEIAATVSAAKGFVKGRLWAVFQPHRYTRTQLLLKDFSPAFRGVDHLWLMDIYPAGETPIEGVSAKLIVEAMEQEGKTPVQWVSSREQIVKTIRDQVKSGDTVLIMGAGDVRKLGEALVEALRQKEASEPAGPAVQRSR